MRMPSKVEDGSRPFQSKDLGFGNIAVLTVLIVAKEERLQPAVRGKALTRVGHIIGRISREDTVDELFRQNLALQRQLSHRNSGERTVPPLEFDLRLDRRFLDKRVLPSSGIQA